MSARKVSFSVITVAYNSAQDLKEFWSATKPSYEWIVVDNASVDDSAAVAAGLGARVIQLPRNVGFSAANNIGASLADSQVFIFLNPDIRVESSEELSELADQACRMQAVVAPQLLNTDGSAQENGRRLPYLSRKLRHFAGADDRSYAVFAEPGQLLAVPWVMGAALAVPKELFEAVGGWDSSFFVYYEDSDFCLRAAEAGYQTLLAGDITLTHGWARETRRLSSGAAWRREIPSFFRFYRRFPRLLISQRGRLSDSVYDVSETRKRSLEP